MSSLRQNITVSRDYRPAPDDCVRALLTLLEKPVIKEVSRPAPEPTDRDGTEVQGGSADACSISN